MLLGTIITATAASAIALAAVKRWPTEAEAEEALPAAAGDGTDENQAGSRDDALQAYACACSPAASRQQDLEGCTSAAGTSAAGTSAAGTSAAGTSAAGTSTSTTGTSAAGISATSARSPRVDSALAALQQMRRAAHAGPDAITSNANAQARFDGNGAAQDEAATGCDSVRATSDALAAMVRSCSAAGCDAELQRALHTLHMVSIRLR